MPVGMRLGCFLPLHQYESRSLSAWGVLVLLLPPQLSRAQKSSGCCESHLASANCELPRYPLPLLQPYLRLYIYIYIYIYTSRASYLLKNSLYVEARGTQEHEKQIERVEAFRTHRSEEHTSELQSQ